MKLPDFASLILLGVLVVLALFFIWRWWTISRATPGGRERPDALDFGTGFVTNFFDTLGIGSFATTTAIFKFRRRMPDEQIPGTLNAGHAVPTFVQAFLFIATVAVDVTTLIAMIFASVLGAWFGAGVVARLPRRAIQLGMGLALLVAATLFVLANLKLIPGGGEALGLSGGLLALAVAINFVLGALMTLGIGLYAPCLITISLLGMNPVVAFPIMMGSCAFLMPPAGVRFMARGRVNFAAMLGLTLGGIPAVLIAALLVRSLPLVLLRWLVVIVVIGAAVMMLRSALRAQPQAALSSEVQA
ncbi:MAG TPA: sulfite exporter TauE/SafE family protein [Steroidobacteraceae bacterium]|nr:sulfite exporter TauE/SafE family protein [Steroidobacteraceae bacterium]